MTKGSIADPLTLTKALSFAPIGAGDTIWLRGGTYTGDYTSALTGAAGNPVTVRPYPGESVIIDGSLTVNGSYTRWRDIQLLKSVWQRVTAEEGSAPSDIPASGLVINGVGTEIINCIIHDVKEVGWWNGAQNSLFYGNLVYYVGWIGPDRGHGHAAYIQNTAGTKLLKDNIFGSCCGDGPIVYSGPSGNPMVGISVIGNSIYSSGLLAVGFAEQPPLLVGAESGTPVVAPIITYNMTQGTRDVLVGYNGGATNVTLENNYFTAGMTEGGGGVSYLSNTGNILDTIGNVVSVRPNEYQTDRANVTVYNEAGANTVAADLTAVTGLIAGDTVQVHNTHDYYTDIQELVLDANKQITINMQAANRSVVAPVTLDAPAETFPTFGAFILMK